MLQGVRAAGLPNYLAKRLTILS